MLNNEFEHERSRGTEDGRHRTSESAASALQGSGALYTALRGLLAASKKGREAYAWVADRTASSEVRRLMQHHELRCASYTLELEQACATLWGDNSGGLLPSAFQLELAPLRQTWFNLRTMLGRSDDRGLVEMCLSGERATLKRYEQALDHPMSSALRALLEQQSRGVEAACGEMIDMFGRLEAAS